MRIARVCCVGCGESWPEMLIAADVFRTTLWANSTSSTTHHGQPPPWLRGVNSTAYPGCAAFQLFSIRFHSTRTRRAFFSSKRFFTCHTVGSAAALPGFPGAPLSVNDVVVTVHDSGVPLLRP